MTDATKTVALAADHAGYPLKDQLRAVIEEQGLAVLDLDTNGPDRVDYPDYGHAMARAIREGRAARGVLVCGTGIGISIAANRHRGIRAALCHDVTTARLCRQHNDANVLALGARIIGFETARDCLAVFLSTDYEGGRHGDRIAKIDVPNA
jgi:ribose 5-phosphate isomerase B